GSVTISIRSYVVTMSVPALVIVLVLGYFLVRAALGIWRAPRRLGASIAQRRSRSAGSRLTQGLIQFSEGNWARSERLLTRSVRSADAPLPNYLMAARAAQQQGAIERRNDWLRRAFEDLPDAEVAILIAQAELQLDNAEDEPAIATLRRALEKQPGNPVATGLLARAYQRLGDAAGIQDLLPSLADAELDPGQRDSLARFALEAAGREKHFDRARADALWNSLDAQLRTRPVLLAWRARALCELDDGASAEAELRRALNRDWMPELVRAWGELRLPDARKHLKQTEGWLRERPEDPVLLLAAARVCMTSQLWGKARSYLESSLAIDPNPAAWALYGQLLTQLGEPDAASEAFRRGLSQAGNVDLDVPLLDSPAADEQTA
ncbi:MAG TPA: heme biosynthesis HemY N-terminal domain-containing protein, partial [Gammaproteobacteria bacterium]|nr:heme biosynthesis HemY N-terminal domain-containing protein [Gammaproteobacteria bacterium]